MKRFRSWSAAACLAAFGVMGCAGEGDAPTPPNSTTPSPGQKPAPPKAAEGPKMEGPKGAAAPASGGASEESLAGLKKLSAADQKLAIAQGVCPVSGEPLGEMGAPIKVTAEGRSFFLCCKSCEADLKEDPKAVVAKLDKKK